MAYSRIVNVIRFVLFSYNSIWACLCAEIEYIFVVLIDNLFYLSFTCSSNLKWENKFGLLHVYGKCIRESYVGWCFSRCHHSRSLQIANDKKKYVYCIVEKENMVGWNQIHVPAKTLLRRVCFYAANIYLCLWIWSTISNIYSVMFGMNTIFEYILLLKMEKMRAHAIAFTMFRSYYSNPDHRIHPLNLWQYRMCVSNTNFR